MKFITKVAIFGLGCMCVISILTSCKKIGPETEPQIEETFENRMEFLGTADQNEGSLLWIYYYRDTTTDVVYMYINEGGFCPVLNADGTPVLWSDIKDQ